MSEAAMKVFTLTPEQEAERLWRGAEREVPAIEEDFVALCAALDLGLRAAQILAIIRIRPVRDRLPATVAALLEHPPEEVDPWRDVVHRPKTLLLAEAIDLLSADELECITPHMHHGWEDRTSSCRRSRKLARAAAGVTLERETRDQLMVLDAYRSRIFERSPPVRVVPAEIVAAFPALRDLVTRLGKT